MIIAVSLFLATLQAPDDFEMTWGQIESGIRRTYYARNLRGKEMEARLSDYAPKAKSAKTRAEFRDTVNKMIAEFHDSHFEYDIEGDQPYYLNDTFGRGPAAKMANIGAWFRRGSDGYTVQMVLEGSDAEKAGLVKGDLMISIDGQPFTPVAGFRADVGKQATIRFKHGGSEVEKKVDVSADDALAMFLRATQKSVRSIELPDGRRFEYIHPWTLLTNDFRRAVRGAVASKSDGFILDLRDGFGGRPEGFDEPFLPAGNGVAKDGYLKPLVILINSGSRSAREVLSYQLHRKGRATLIGRKTAGYVLGTMPYRINDWSNLEIPVVEVKIDGVRLEGVGVNPDISVPSERDPSGKDLDIEAAVSYLKEHTINVFQFEWTSLTLL